MDRRSFLKYWIGANAVAATDIAFELNGGKGIIYFLKRLFGRDNKKEEATNIQDYTEAKNALPPQTEPFEDNSGLEDKLHDDKGKTTEPKIEEKLDDEPEHIKRIKKLHAQSHKAFDFYRNVSEYCKNLDKKQIKDILKRLKKEKSEKTEGASLFDEVRWGYDKDRDWMLVLDTNPEFNKSITELFIDQVIAMYGKWARDPNKVESVEKSSSRLLPY